MLFYLLLKLLLTVLLNIQQRTKLNADKGRNREPRVHEALCSEKVFKTCNFSLREQTLIFLFPNFLCHSEADHTVKYKSPPQPTVSKQLVDGFSTWNTKRVQIKTTAVMSSQDRVKHALHVQNTRVSEGNWEGRNDSSILIHNCLGSQKRQQRAKVNVFQAPPQGSQSQLSFNIQWGFITDNPSLPPRIPKFTDIQGPYIH